MIKLQPLFSNNALFQHTSPLCITGITDNKSAIKASIISKDNVVISLGESYCSEDGSFSIKLNTPPASYDFYSIKIESNEDSVLVNDVLFGELWLASGQSNMEMPNGTQIECDKLLESLKGKKLRFFWQSRNPGGHTGSFPYTPEYFTDGKWATMDDTDLIKNVSACATAFSNVLYEYFKSNKKDIPVGFVNSSQGGTLIEPWLPREAFEEDKEIEEYLKKIDRYPTEENWNNRGEQNYQQTTCMFNKLIAPHIGAKFKGVIWYQGESNSGAEYQYRIYAKLLKTLRKQYKKLFAISDDDTFPIISSMIYSWEYGQSGETNVGYLNNAFVTLANEFPNEFPFIQICDLKPIWGAHIKNHPIHPLHKYVLGERMALLTLNTQYGRKVKNTQKLPATLKSCVKHGNKLRLTFKDYGTGLYIKDNKKTVRGLYISSNNGVYTPAYAEIVNKNTMNVWHPFIKNPKHVAYAFSSFEAETNLMCGEFGVAPFATETNLGDRRITILKKPWLNLENESEFTNRVKPNVLDTFRNPIYYPGPNSTVCFDPDFTLGTRSLRVGGINSKHFSTYVQSEKYADLDLQNYLALNVSLLVIGSMKAKLVINYRDDSKILSYAINGEPKETLQGNWVNYRFDFSEIPNGTIKNISFEFEVSNESFDYVNIDNLILEPKN